MINRSKYRICIAGAAAFVCLKLFYKLSTTDDLYFLLGPVSWVIKMITGYAAMYVPGKGFFFRADRIIINKSCSGFSFMLICLTLTVLLLVKYSRNEVLFLKRLVTGIGISYLFTLLVNSARILTLLWIKKTAFCTSRIAAGPLHELLGAFIYLLYLTTAYLISDHYLRKKYENSPQPKMDLCR
ncbi:MAG TPA: exosortase K [Niabella sp.]